MAYLIALFVPPLAHRVYKEAKSVEIQSMLYLGHTISLTDRLLSVYYHSLTVIIQTTSEPSSQLELVESRWKPAVLYGSVTVTSKEFSSVESIWDCFCIKSCEYIALETFQHNCIFQLNQ